MKTFFIGYALSGREKDAVDALREKISAMFGVTAALRIPPHITLFSPFEADAGTRWTECLGRIAEARRPFSVPIVSFAAFGEAVWFLDPVQDEALTSLQKRVASAVKECAGIDEREDRRGRHFHITLAYKDVSPDAHRRIGEFLRSQPLPIDVVTVDSVTLFERMADEKGWTPAETFRFHWKAT